jgi:hypothetical protein
MRRAEDGVEMAQAVRAYLYRTWVRKKSRKSWGFCRQVLMSDGFEVNRLYGDRLGDTIPADRLLQKS